MDPIKEMMTQGASQLGMMNTQLATGIASALTQSASQLNMMAISMASAAPDLGAMAPAGMPGIPGIPTMRPAPVVAPAAPVAAARVSASPTRAAFAPAFKPRMIR